MGIYNDVRRAASLVKRVEDGLQEKMTWSAICKLRLAAFDIYRVKDAKEAYEKAKKLLSNESLRSVLDKLLKEQADVLADIRKKELYAIELNADIIRILEIALANNEPQ